MVKVYRHQVGTRPVDLHILPHIQKGSYFVSGMTKVIFSLWNSSPPTGSKNSLLDITWLHITMYCKCHNWRYLVRFPRPTPRRWVGGPMSRKGGDETVSVSASFRCSPMGECDTDLEFCLSKDLIGVPKVGIDHRWNLSRRVWKSR